MSVLENFKNILRSPYGGRQGSNVIFFFKFATKSLEKKKRGACRPPNGRQAPVARPRGDRPVGICTKQSSPCLHFGHGSLRLSYCRRGVSLVKSLLCCGGNSNTGSGKESGQRGPSHIMGSPFLPPFLSQNRSNSSR